MRKRNCIKVPWFAVGPVLIAYLSLLGFIFCWWARVAEAPSKCGSAKDCVGIRLTLCIPGTNV